MVNISVQLLASPGIEEHSLVDEKISGTRYWLNVKFRPQPGPLFNFYPNRFGNWVLNAYLPDEYKTMPILLMWSVKS